MSATWRGSCRKNTFATRAEARAHAKWIKHHEEGGALYAYECPGCGKWHLTSQTPREQRRIAKLMGRR